MSSPKLLTVPRIEAKPKHVRMLPRFKAQLLQMRQDEKTYFSTIFGLLNRILAGEGLPENFYRDWIDVDVDDVLVKYGYMHLHFAPKRSGEDRLLILQQYDSLVIACKVSGHDIFKPPPGAALASELKSDVEKAVEAYDAERASGQPINPLK